MHSSLSLTLALLVCGLSPILNHSGDGESTALDAGLESVSAERMSADLHFLASDEMAGRDTPSRGQEIAALFLRNRLQRLGMQPGTEHGFFYEYPLNYRKFDEAGSGASISSAGSSERLSFGQDYFLGRSTELFGHTTTASMVYVGKGNSSDIEDANLQGKWGVVQDGNISIRRVTEKIKEAGAVGLVILEDPDAKKSYGEKFRRTSDALIRGSVSKASKRTRGQETFPKVLVASAAAERMRARATEGWGDLTFTETRRNMTPGGRRLLKNVAGMWPGSDPVLSKEVIIISAHFDHVGTRGGKIYNGADDNGSGTTGLLALAEALTHYGPMRRSILLMWVSGEEKGLWGSAAWTQRPWLPEGHYPVANVNIDMIGRNAPNDLMITPTKAIGAEYNGLTRLAEKLGPIEGFPKFRSADDYWRRSDHVNFAVNLGLPVAFLFADVHEDYHGAGDIPQKIGYDKMRRVVRLVLRMLDGMQGDKLELHDRAIPTMDEFQRKVRISKAYRDLEKLRVCMAQYEVNHGEASPDLAVLLDLNEEGTSILGWPAIPTDPWGSDYIFVPAAAAEAAVWLSYGSDGAPGGEGEAADIVL